MKPIRRILLIILGLLAASVASSRAASKPEQWSDGQGNKFRGTPAEVIGPFALFRTDNNAGRRVLLRFLTEEDCVRFQRGLPKGAGETVAWNQTTGELSREFPTNVYRLAGDKLERAALDRVPEPKLLVLLYVSGSADRFRDFIEECIPAYGPLRAKFPDMCEFVYASVRRSVSDHLGLARGTAMPWLIVDFDRVPNMERTRRLAPGRDQWLWVVNRDGVPLISTAGVRTADVKQALGELEGMLVLLRPDNPRTWPDRLHYFRAIHAAENREGKADPLLVGNPVDAEALRELGVSRLEAAISVAADGAVSRVEISPVGNVTQEIADAVGRTLRQAALVPAVDRGAFVDGVYNLRMDIPAVAPAAN